MSYNACDFIEWSFIIIIIIIIIINIVNYL